MSSVPPPDFRALFEGCPGLYLVVTPDAPRYTIVAVSDAYLAATLTTRPALLGLGIFEAFPDNPHDPAASGVRNLGDSLDRVRATLAAHTMAIQKYDIPRVRPAHGEFELRYWSVVNSPIRGPEGLRYIVHRVEDVTEFVRLQARQAEKDTLTDELLARVERSEAEVFARARELQRANRELLEAQEEIRRLNADLEARVERRTHDLEAAYRELEGFSYTVAHDLRAPLRSVHRHAEALLEEYAGRVFDAGAAGRTRRILDAADRMDRLIGDLLAYARIPRQEIVLSPVDVGRLVPEVLRGLDTTRADLVVEPGLPKVVADPVLLSQALENLLSNAMKFVAPGLRARVRVHAGT
ncbi:MAG: sensor histidine kinase, partial [Myxococcota bacterium]